jgi:hypothetical protein
LIPKELQNDILSPKGQTSLALPALPVPCLLKPLTVPIIGFPIAFNATAGRV